jgi:hypothetical protein
MGLVECEGGGWDGALSFFSFLSSLPSFVYLPPPPSSFTSISPCVSLRSSPSNEADFRFLPFSPSARHIFASFISQQLYHATCHSETSLSAARASAASASAQATPREGTPLSSSTPTTRKRPAEELLSPLKVGLFRNEEGEGEHGDEQPLKKVKSEPGTEGGEGRPPLEEEN